MYMDIVGNTYNNEPTENYLQLIAAQKEAERRLKIKDIF